PGSAGAKGKGEAATRPGSATSRFTRHVSRGPQFLAEQFEIDYAYSATVLKACLDRRADPARKRPAGSLLVFAHPDATELIASGPRGFGVDARGDEIRDLFGERSGFAPLPGMAEEAKALKGLYPDARIYLDKEATKSRVLQEAGKYRYLHFATHGLFNEAAPMMSAVVLSPPSRKDAGDAFLTAREITDMDLTAAMVVL